MELKATLSLMLPAQAQIVLFWGPEFIAFYNDAYAPTIGSKHPRALGRPAKESWTELWDDLKPLLNQVLETGETVVAKDRPFYIERHGYPENVYFDISYSPVWKASGDVGGVLCIVSETTERVVAQERQRLIIQETNHRLKNLFAMIDAIISLSARSARTPQDFAQTIRGRLAALLRAKELIRPGIMGTEQGTIQATSIGALVNTIMEPYHDADGRDRIHVLGPEVVVGATALTTIALALHESATNAVKYGSLSTPNGKIKITWEARDNNFRLEWEEVGGPTITGNPTAQGFGSVLTGRSVAQLGGTIEHDWHEHGLKLRLSVPLDRLSA